jgi:hypothetical protein
MVRSCLQLPYLAQEFQNRTHHAEGVFDPNPMNKQMVTIFGNTRACRFRKHQFENRSWLLPLPTFFKTWFKFIKYSQNWSKLTDFQTFLDYFHVFQVVEEIIDILTTNIVKNETFSKKSKKSFLDIFCQFQPHFIK